jgi:hypothetical protein
MLPSFLGLALYGDEYLVSLLGWLNPAKDMRVGTSQSRRFCEFADILTVPVYLGRGKAIPLQALTGPEACSRLRLPEVVDSRHDMKVATLPALSIGRLCSLSRINCLVLNSVREWVDPMALWKTSVIPSEIESAIFPHVVFTSTNCTKSCLNT